MSKLPKPTTEPPEYGEPQTWMDKHNVWLVLFLLPTVATFAIIVLTGIGIIRIPHL